MVYHHYHYYILGNDINGWSLATCKWCGCKEVYQNNPRMLKMEAIPPTPQEKRAFLRSQGIAITSKYYTEKERIQIIKSVSSIGVGLTAKKYNVPRSTVGLWSKGKSPHRFKGNKYTIDFKKRVARTADKTNNNKLTSKLFNVPRGSVQSWRKQYCKKVLYA